ncbi:MAG: NAD(P)/FAD-dependent oxidoreductase [Vicinamibacterales bacterium]
MRGERADGVDAGSDMGAGEDNTVTDIAIVGAGAAGLFAAIAAATARPGVRVVVLEGARTVGAKILVSGGSRCNVTNAEVTERDFRGGSSRVVRRVLRAFPAAAAAAWFGQAGVALHEEAGGKLFPDTHRSRTVLDALLRECARFGVTIRTSARVSAVAVAGDGFTVTTAAGVVRAPVVLLATGGLSLPKSGSDGFGYQLARRLGHSLVPTTPALVPLVLAGSPCATLAGVSHEAALTVVDAGARSTVTGSLLWTHAGLSGPAALDVSRVWLRAVEEGRQPSLVLSALPGVTFEALEQRIVDIARTHPRGTIRSSVAGLLPAAVGDALLADAGVDPGAALAQLPRDVRRAAIRALLEWPVPVAGSRGYQYAEVTAGGVPLDEISAATMESRLCPGLYLAGEILDVDGRLGGFNFQWAWSSGWVAGRAMAARCAAIATA